MVKFGGRPFSANIHFGPECWEWMSSKSTNGYGLFWDSSRNKHVAAHRVAYEDANGPIPIGMEVMHSCDNRSCVRRDHLSIGTHSDNLQDCANKKRHNNSRKTECKQGHEYSEENTYMRPNGGRGCKTCIKNASKKRVQS